MKKITFPIIINPPNGLIKCPQCKILHEIIIFRNCNIVKKNNLFYAANCQHLFFAQYAWPTYQELKYFIYQKYNYLIN